MLQIEKYCNNYTNFERIGVGSYANIYKAQNKKTKRVMLQLKKLIKDDINH